LVIFNLQLPNLLTLYTIGHSTRELADLIATLQAHGIRALASAVR
jgi:hypothetical protein